MASLINTVKGILTYKEPKGPQNIEFLEDNRNDSNEENQNNTSSKDDSSGGGKEETKTEYQGQPDKGDMVKNLNENLDRMKREFNIPKNLDVLIREFKVARKIDAFIIYIDGMVDTNIINDYILRQLMSQEYFDELNDNYPVNYIKDNILSINRVTKENKYGMIIRPVLNGATVLFVDGCDECLIIENQGYEKRNVDKPVTENVIRGSQEGFTENMRTNITLIRRIIKNKNLITEIMPIDKTNETNCAVLYLQGIANPAVINEVKRRITNLNIDFISGSGMLEELISDHTLMPFSQIMTTERPDRAASSIMDGKVILVLEGSPFVSTIPSSFFEAIQSSEDYFLKWQYAAFLRYLRLLALFIAVLLPGLYGAMTLFHQEMVPTELLNSIVKSRENVPFPTLLEIIFMEISFELIREGGIRVPGVIGNTLGIVGALILGQAAVQAQLVSPVLIIIIAMVGISSFAIPSYSKSFELRLLRFVFILSGGFTGFYGIAVALVIILGLACSLKSFGVPYFVPVAPKTRANPDVVSTFSSYKFKIRPDYINPLNKHKAGKITDEWKFRKGGDKNDK